MDESRWRRLRDDRSIRYAGRRLDPERWICLSADPSYTTRYDGQVAILTATNLLGRMTPSLALAFQDAPLHQALPAVAPSLHQAVLDQLRAADPFTRARTRTPAGGDVRVHLGRQGEGLVAHGLGWNSFAGTSASPLPPAPDGNPIGAAFAAVLAASQLFVHDLAPPTQRTVVDTLRWLPEINRDAPAPEHAEVGSIFVVGVGSVGTAVLYFLTLAPLTFSPTLIDADLVEIHNLDRSPIFGAADEGLLKVDATAAFLRARGVRDVVAEPCLLHQAGSWIDRPSGAPDLVVSAANENHARYWIESQYPPPQVYGTTGRNWQASLVRHAPFVDACSCCLFPPDRTPEAPMACGSAPAVQASSGAPQVDAALPFLSFAAGLMAAAEILKAKLPGYPFSANRVSLLTRPSARLVSAPVVRRNGCLCNDRNEKIHRRMLEGGRFAHLSRESAE